MLVLTRKSQESVVVHTELCFGLALPLREGTRTPMAFHDAGETRIPGST